MELMRQCAICDGIGPLGHLCVECEDQAMIYEAFELKDDTSDKVVMNEKDFDKFKESTVLDEDYVNDDNKNSYKNLMSHYMVVEKQLVELSLQPDLLNKANTVYRDLNEFDLEKVPTANNFYTAKNVFSKR